MISVGDTVRITTLEHNTTANGLTTMEDSLNVGDGGVVKAVDLLWREPCAMIGTYWYAIQGLECVDVQKNNPQPDEDFEDSYNEDDDEEDWDMVEDFLAEDIDDEDFDDEDIDDESEDEMEYVYILTGDSLSISASDGRSELINSAHTDFKRICQLVLDEDMEGALSAMCPATGIEKWGAGSLSIEDGNIYYNTSVGNIKMTGVLVDKIISLMALGDAGFENLARFLNGVMEQTSLKTRERLMEFASQDKLDIDEKGRVIAFKNVRSDYMDKHSGTFRNKVGDIPSMRREDVDDDHDHTCSRGLHVCSPAYLSGFWGTSGKTMKVAVEARDFVAFPSDYQNSKARVCRYEVVEDVTNDISKYL